MLTIIKTLLTGMLLVQWATLGVHAANYYQLDNSTISKALNASEGTEPEDNWFGNVFTAVAGANQITRVDYALWTTAGASAKVVIYQVTDPGGDPALGATRIYTQSFTPLTGDGVNAYFQGIVLSSPVNINTGDKFLVAVYIPNVIALPPNAKYPYLLDTSGVATGSYWDRSAPGSFNLDNLSQAKLVNQAMSPGGYVPGNGHIILRAVGVPEPSVFALGTLATAAMLLFRRREQ